MKTWLVSDWHLGEDRFEIMSRPFKTQLEMIDLMVERHNTLVNQDDTVYVLGDVCYQKHPEFLSQVERFNGRKILVRGNHDRVFTDEDFAPYFEQIIPEGKGIEIDFDGVPCYLTHYPTQGVKDRFNIVGHIHAAWKYQLNMINVGVDVQHFMPVDASSIPFHLKAITEFYDKDVWVGYEELNAQYVGVRGKQSSYFGG